MTKLKNTKKGMAKKALSISLVAAMLATSNVPVWAAEFGDGTDVAPVIVEEATAEVDLFSDAAEETPVVPTEEPVAETPVVQAMDDASDVNLNNYKISNLAIGTVGSWDLEVGVSGRITYDGVHDVEGLQYTWMADGQQAAGPGATGSASEGENENWIGHPVSWIEYKPVLNDYGKTLSLRIYEIGENGSIVFSKTITGGKVQAKDISGAFKEKNVFLEDVIEGKLTYNGNEQKPSATVEGLADIKVKTRDEEEKSLASELIDWHYETAGNDFTNVTGKDITVYGTLVGTDDPASITYGYTAKTDSVKYQISKLPVTSSNLKPSLVTTSVEYTGTTHNFGKKDTKLEVEVGDKKIDITAALKDSFNISGEDTAVGTGYSINITEDKFKFDDTAEAKKILQNFDFALETAVNTTNTYSIAKRNLSNCTAKAEQEFLIDTFKGKDSYDLKEAEMKSIKLTGKDGRSFSLWDIKDDVVVQINNAVFNAANADRKGVVSNAITISYQSDSKNVSGSVSLPITLAVRSLGKVTVDGIDKMPTAKADAADFSVDYTGKAYNLQSADYNLTVYDTDGKEVKSSEYTVSYSDNVNAGIVEVTITGKDSYAGSTKKVYFTIKPHTVVNDDFKVKASVTVNPSNNHDASLYKTALDGKFVTTINGNKVTLKEGTDYTVKYYYVDGVYTSEKDIKDHLGTGTNNPDQYVYAVATPVKNGNYTAEEFIYGAARIAKKSISNVTVTVEKDSYTFTGKEIVPKIVVKDGSVTLEKGVDYTLKFKDNINVGTATVTVIPKSDPECDYDPETSATATFKIEAAKAEDVKVSLKEKGADKPATKFNYTGKQIKPVVDKVTLNGVDVTNNFDITYPEYGENVNSGKDMGSVTISPKATTKNFTGKKTQNFDIVGKKLEGILNAYYTDKTKVNVSDEKIALNKYDQDYSFYYDGAAQTFGSESFVPDAEFDVKQGEDYEIKYINNVNAGVAFVAVVAKGNYEGKANVDFVRTDNEGNSYNVVGGYYVEDGQLMIRSTVVEKNIVDIIAFRIQPSFFTARNITVANGTYAGGLPVKPEVTVSIGGKELTEGKDYYLEITAINGNATPDKFTNVTADKPYYVTVRPMGGYEFDDVNGSNTYVWGIDKKDLADCFVAVAKDGTSLAATVMNGNVTETKEAFTVKDNGDGTATVSVVDGGKNYTGSATVKINGATETVGQAMITDVVVVGNKATAVLSGHVENAGGYDYVIATEDDYKSGRVDVTKNQLGTTGDFYYVEAGTYYAYCHAWKRDENGKKVFGDWSNVYKFTVTATTPSTPKVVKVKANGSTVTVTYTQCDDATGYDVVLGKSIKKVHGESRPVNYGTLVSKVKKGNVVTATFKNVPKGSYYAGLHAYNRTSENGKKVFSPWSNTKKVTVK